MKNYYNAKCLSILTTSIWSFVLICKSWAEQAGIQNSEGVNLVNVLGFIVVVLVGAVNSLVIYIFIQNQKTNKDDIKWLKENCLTEQKHKLICELVTTKERLEEEKHG